MSAAINVSLKYYIVLTVILPLKYFLNSAVTKYFILFHQQINRDAKLLHSHWTVGFKLHEITPSISLYYYIHLYSDLTVIKEKNIIYNTVFSFTNIKS